MAIVALFFLSYGTFEARRLLFGPELRIVSPKDGSATSSTAILISGTASNIAFLSINDASAYTDPSGHFTDMRSIPPGYAVIKVWAKDRFGRQVTSLVHFTVLNYCPVNA